MSEGGYSVNCRSAIETSITQMRDNPKYTKFCDVLLENQKDPENLDTINRMAMPNLHKELVKILSSYCQSLPNQVYRPSFDKVEQIVSICNSSYLYGHVNDNLGLTEESLKKRLSNGKLPEYYTAVVTGENENSNIFAINDNNAELSGFITIKENPSQNIEILNLFIDPNKTGQGLGSQLIREIQILSRYKKCRILVNVASHNERAISFYQKNGFITIKEKYRTTQCTDNVPMQVDLMEIPQGLTERMENWIKYIFYQAIIELATRTSTFVAKKI